MKETLRQFKVWSNIFYFPTFLLALYWQLPVTAFFIAAVVVFGTLYHLSHEKRWFLPDAISAYLLIFTNLVLCYEGGFKAPYFWIALMFVALAFTYHYYLQQRGEYSFNHGMWHVYGSLITLFCIFTVVF